MAVAHEASSAVRLGPAVSETAERLFQEHSGWIHGYCLRMLRSPEEAEDALQATYLNACRSLKDGFQPRVDSAWLLRIAQNVCLTRRRSSGRRARLERVQDVELIEETVAAPAHHGDELIGLTDALASLPEQQRRAILLREWQGLSYAEVAGRLGVTQAAVETLIFRARRALASALENPGKRRRLRLAHGLDIAGLVAAAKGFFAGSAAAKVAAAVVVAATTATVAATDPAGVWRDRTPVAPSTPAEAPAVQPRAAGVQAATTASAQAAPAAAERAFFAPAGGPVVRPAERGKALGKAKAAAGKANGKANGQAEGKAVGKAAAPGQAKKPAQEQGAKGQGGANAQRPEFAGETGPPPQAFPQGGATPPAPKASAETKSAASSKSKSAKS